MATSIATALATISGVTWVDICERTAGKTLSDITEADWKNIGGFREGTFNFTGDEMTITDQKYENGQNITSTTKDGTYGFEGNMPNVHPLICKELLNMEDVDVSSALSGAYVDGKKVIGYGNKIGLKENVFVRLRFEQGYYDSLIYLMSNLSTRLQGSGSSEDLLDLAVTCSTSKSTDDDTEGLIFVLVERAAP